MQAVRFNLKLKVFCVNNVCIQVAERLELTSWMKQVELPYLLR